VVGAVVGVASGRNPQPATNLAVLVAIVGTASSPGPCYAEVFAWPASRPPCCWSSMWRPCRSCLPA